VVFISSIKHSAIKQNPTNICQVCNLQVVHNNVLTIKEKNYSKASFPVPYIGINPGILPLDLPQI